MAAWFSALRDSGNLIVRTRKRLPWMNGFFKVGMPSSFTAFIILWPFLAFGSEMTYIVLPFPGLLPSMASSRVHCLKEAPRPSTTKVPTSMPLRFSCFSQASFKTSMSFVSARATFSTPGQSQSSKVSHSVLADSPSSSGLKPLAIGFTISPGEVLMMSLRPSRWTSSIWKPQRASTREMSLSMYKSAPFLLKMSCGCSFSIKFTSPVSASGCSSAFSRNTTLWLSVAPFWTTTSSTSRSDFDLKDLPCPPHSWHADCICWIMGPIRITCTVTPRPSHPAHFCTPFFLSTTCRVIAIFLVTPV
mmetsp:Transcript_101926/g.183883  ORF Transcript_101926/g.183883 Transcript_101926/m.183883 type:complete len:303 (-) Transcript_101926:1037-1945(-)